MSNQFNFTFRNEEYVGVPAQDDSYISIYKDGLEIDCFGPERVQDIRMNHFFKLEDTLVGACILAYAKVTNGSL